MSGDIQGRVYSWIDQQALAAPGREQLTGLRLAHLNSADQLQVIAHYALNIADQTRIHDLKAEIFRTANEVAIQWSGFQRFAVQAFFGDATAAGAYFPFSLSGQETQQMLGATEPPNMVGLLRQTMRHLEVQAKINAGLLADGNTALVRQNASLADALEKTQQKYYDLLSKSESIITQTEERAFTRTRLERSETRKDQLAARVIEALPIVVNKVSQHFGGPALLTSGGPSSSSSTVAAGAGEMVLADMLRNLTDTTFEQLLNCFPNPLHKGYVIELYRTHVLEPHKRAQAAAAKTNGGPPDGATH